MRAEDVEIAGAFLAALEEAAESGSREAVYPLLAPDVEWVTPKRTLRGIDEIREELTWGFAAGEPRPRVPGRRMGRP